MQTPIAKGNNSHPRPTRGERIISDLFDVVYGSEFDVEWERACERLAGKAKIDVVSFALVAKRLSQVVESLQEVKAELQALKPKA